MPRLSELVAGGDCGELVPSFPGVTCSVQANMTTGLPPAEHGVVANGFYFREQKRVEMWTTPNSCIKRPQLWDIMHEHDARLSAACWFGLHSIGAGADVICWPAPKHNPDGTESLWCYTKPEPLYEKLLEQFGHFPLQHFWGPFANIKSTEWIVTSAIFTAERYRPNLFYIYLSHLDYAAQKDGPDSPAALAALNELDEQIGRLVDGLRNAYAGSEPLWLVASEYVITPVDHVTYPNRILREAGLLSIETRDGAEHLDFDHSKAWALVDHQFSHVFVRDEEAVIVEQVCRLFDGQPCFAEVIPRAEQRGRGATGDGGRRRADLRPEQLASLLLVA